MEPSHNGYRTLLHPRSLRQCVKGKRGDRQSRRTGESAVRPCLLITSERALIQYYPSMRRTSLTAIDVPKWARKSPQASAYTKNHRQLRSTQSRRPYLLVIIYQIVSLENIHISNIIQAEPLYLRIYAYTYIHVIINEKIYFIYNDLYLY